MQLGFVFFFNSVLLGIGLAMDAFSVSMANGLNEPAMKARKQLGVAGVFAGFQFLMPLLGWVCVHTVTQFFHAFESWIPWIALALLSFIGGKMLLDSVGCHEDEKQPAVGLYGLLLQGVATSIDALSVGFTIASYALAEALLACFLIGAVTFFICLAGLEIGKRAGTRLANKAGVLGGLILIFIGVEILISHYL